MQIEQSQMNLNFKHEYVRHKYITYNFHKLQNFVAIDWDNAYHRAFGQDFGFDYFDGPKQLTLE